MSQTILFVCATGIATSTAVTEKVFLPPYFQTGVVS